jgi:hypothetical protein
MSTLATSGLNKAAQAVIVIVWIFYLAHSERVKQTFVR